MSTKIENIETFVNEFWMFDGEPFHLVRYACDGASYLCGFSEGLLIIDSGSTYANPKVSAMIEVKRNNVSRVKYRCKCGAHYLTKQKSARIAGGGASCSHCKVSIEYVSSVVVPSNHPKFVKGE